MPSKKENSNRYLLILKAVVFLIICWFIYVKITDNSSDFNSMLSLIPLRIQPFQIAILLLLVPVNWGIEIVKWRYLVEKISPVSWVSASKGVLAGVALGFVTPHAIGDYFGRINALKTVDKKRYIGLVMVSRLAQMMITALAGLWGLYLLYSKQDVVIVVLCLLILAISIFLLLKFITSGKRNSYISSVGRLFVVLRRLEWRDYTLISLLSLLRYLVFWFQMTWVISLLAQINWHLAAAGSTWIFLSKSVLPAFNFLSDLGVREASAIYFFENYHISPAPVVAATLMVWCINILLPTLAGALILLKTRIR